MQNVKSLKRHLNQGFCQLVNLFTTNTDQIQKSEYTDFFMLLFLYQLHQMHHTKLSQTKKLLFIINFSVPPFGTSKYQYSM